MKFLSEAGEILLAKEVLLAKEGRFEYWGESSIFFSTENSKERRKEKKT